MAFRLLYDREYFIYISVVVVTKDNGKMGKDMDLEWRRGVGGYIGVNGRKVLRVAMGLGNRTHQRPNTKELGPTDYKTVMVLRLMLMMVSRCNF